MNNRKFIIINISIFIIEFLILEGNGIYPFPELFLPLLFLDYKSKNMPIKAFIVGLFMDLSTNNIGIFSFSYSFYSILVMIISSYLSDFDNISIFIFFIYDLTIKFTNILLIFLKFHTYHINYIYMIYSIALEIIGFVIIRRLLEHEK